MKRLALIYSIAIAITSDPVRASEISATLNLSVKEISGEAKVAVGQQFNVQARGYTEPSDYQGKKPGVRQSATGWSGSDINSSKHAIPTLAKQCNDYAARVGKRVTGAKNEYSTVVTKFSNGVDETTYNGRSVIYIGKSRLTKVSFDSPIECSASYNVSVRGDKVSGLAFYSIYSNGSVDSGRRAVDRDGNVYKGNYSTHNSIVSVTLNVEGATID
jgi:hypothetical protein